MNPAALRDANFEGLRDTLTERRADVYRAFFAFGPCTTVACAERSGIGLLTLRPRATELEQMGLIECVNTVVIGRTANGIYRVREREAWEAWRAQLFPVGGQLQMGLNQGALTS